MAVTTASGIPDKHWQPPFVALDTTWVFLRLGCKQTFIYLIIQWSASFIPYCESVWDENSIF